MHITTYNLHKTTKWCIMNNENIRKIYTENINANVILAFKQSNADVTRVTVRQKGQMKNQRFYLIKITEKLLPQQTVIFYISHPTLLINLLG